MSLSSLYGHRGLWLDITSRPDRRVRHFARSKGARRGRHTYASSGTSFQTRRQTLSRFGVQTYDFGTRYLQQGCVGEDVSQLQNFLRAEGFMREPDAYPGYFGTVTQDAVIKWQKQHQLPPTGGFGDLARDTYLQKQELKVQSHMASKEPGVEQAGPLAVAVPEPASLAPLAGVSDGVRLAAAFLLVAAAVVGGVQAWGWWWKKQQGGSYVDSWVGDLRALKQQLAEQAESVLGPSSPSQLPPDSDGSAAVWASQSAAPAASPAYPQPQGQSQEDVEDEEEEYFAAVSSPYGTYFRPLSALKAELEGSGNRSSSGATGVPKGAYFGGSVQRAAFTPQNRPPWDSPMDVRDPASDQPAGQREDMWRPQWSNSSGSSSSSAAPPTQPGAAGQQGDAYGGEHMERSKPISFFTSQQDPKELEDHPRYDPWGGAFEAMQDPDPRERGGDPYWSRDAAADPSDPRRGASYYNEAHELDMWSKRLTNKFAQVSAKTDSGQIWISNKRVHPSDPEVGAPSGAPSAFRTPGVGPTEEPPAWGLPKKRLGGLGSDVRKNYAGESSAAGLGPGRQSDEWSNDRTAEAAEGAPPQQQYSYRGEGRPGLSAQWVQSRGDGSSGQRYAASNGAEPTEPTD